MAEKLVGESEEMRADSESFPPSLYESVENCIERERERERHEN